MAPCEGTGPVSGNAPAPAIFVRGSVQVRYAQPTDVPELVQLGALMNPVYRVSEDRIARRVARAGVCETLVLDVDGTVEGVLYATRTTRDALPGLSFESAFSGAQLETGNCALWIHLILKPEARHLCDTFHGEAKKHFFGSNCTEILALTHCSAFASDDASAIENYCANHAKSDRNLFFHSSRGATVDSVLHGYNHADISNHGSAIAMRYVPTGSAASGGAGTEGEAEAAHKHAAADTEARRTCERLLAVVCNRLGIQTGALQGEALDTPWFELGFDSMTMMALHTDVEQALQTTLDVSFLFGRNTPRKLLAFVQADTSADGAAVPAGTNLDAREALAIHGIGLRFPGPEGPDTGDIETCEALWEALMSPDPIAFRRVLRNRDRFDLSAFQGSLTAEQARTVPLMQRLVLEATQACLADAPQELVAAAKGRIGIFVGAWDACEYAQAGEGEMPSVHTLAGLSTSILANRVSYLLDLSGPSVVIDTACSSSLVALDFARAAITEGKCELAVIIGVNVLHETRSELLRQANFMSPSAQCFSMDSRADGYVRSEGCGAVLLGRQSGANPARALLHAVNVNQDGRTVNLHAPNPEAQKRLFEGACERAGVLPRQVCFVEGHLTGTKLGDSIEAASLQAVYGESREANDAKLLLTATKAKFGHSESAAGILGLIHTVLCLQKRTLPPNPHLVEGNPAIPMAKYALKVVQAAQALPGGQDTQLFAGVSSFGFGGTNAHAIMSSVRGEGRSAAQLQVIDWAARCQDIPYRPFFSLSSGRPVQQQEQQLSVSFDDDTLEFLGHHRVAGLSVIPGTFLACLMASKVGGAWVHFEDVQFTSMLTLPTDDRVAVRHAGTRVSIQSASGAEAAAAVIRAGGSDTFQGPKLSAAQARCKESLHLDYHSLGNAYAGPFRGVRQLWASQDAREAVGSIEIPKAAAPAAGPAGALLGRAALLDSVAHACFALLPAEVVARPIYAAGFAELTIADPCGSRLPAWCHVRRSDEEPNGGADEARFDWAVWDERGDLVAKCTNFAFGFFEDTVLRRIVFKDSWGAPSVLPAADKAMHDMSMLSGAAMHKTVLEVLSGAVGPHSFVVANEEQAAFLRSVQAERPGAGVQIVWRTTDDERNIQDEATRRLQRLPHACDAAGPRFCQVRKGGTYLVTGGLGALGRCVAEALVERGASEVVLLGRSPPSESVPHGAQFVYVQCDASDQGAMHAAVAPFAPRVKGVFHCAGLLQSGTLEALSEADFDVVYSAKVRSARNMLAALRDAPLDFAVLFSSITAGTGAAGQSNYAAANGALDDIARDRAAASIPILSVRWGPWAEVGMASTFAERWERMGLVPLNRVTAVRALFALRADLDPVVTIANVEPTRLASALPAMASYVSASAGAVTAAHTGDIAELEGIVRQVGCMAGLGDAKDIDLDLPWREAGLDSLGMVEFRNLLQSRLGDSQRLHDTVLFDHGTPAQLLSWLAQTCQPAGAPAPPPQSPLRRQAAAGGTLSPAAVTGVSCRLPGAVSSPQEFWELLCSGRDAISSVPLGRFDAAELAEHMYTERGGFLADIERFDFGRFAMSEQEARSMDPQQRLALSLAAEALESAGLGSGNKAATKRVGVYVGVMVNDWATMTQQKGASAATPYSASGHIPCVIANRISYALGLTGPSLSVNTACSSSLVALDLAMSAIRLGQCDAAVVVGVNLILHPALYIEECAARMLSPQGRCATFSDGADGYVRGEGCVAMVLEPASAAASKPAWGLVHGVSVNQDGRSANLTSPSGWAQQQVVRDALAQAQVPADQVEFVETHGTGTPLGDPIEVGALAQVFAPSPSRERPLCLGAAKSIVGHGESASGLTGVLKALLCLQHQQVPPNVHCTAATINPKVQSSLHDQIVLPFVPQRLSAGAFAGVSSFGFGGTNAHAIVSALGCSPPQGNNAAFAKRDESVAPRLSWNEPSRETYAVQWRTWPGERESPPANAFTVDTVAAAAEILAQVRQEDAVEILFITRDDASGVLPADAAAVWGFVRSARLERPRSTLHLLRAPRSAVIGAGAKLALGHTEHRLGTDGSLKVPSLHRLAFDIAPFSLEWPLQGGAPCVLVTGASGGIGREVVRFIIEQMRVRDVVCASRSRPEGLPACARWVECDVTDATKLAALKAECPRPTAIFHVAGLLEERSLDDFEPAWLERHVAVKTGALATLTAHFADSVRTVVAFSSTSALLGMKRGAAYAASNAALDAHVETLRAQGLAAISIQWDMWAETGMAFDRSMTKAGAARGLPSRRACHLLAGILGNLDRLPAAVVVAAADMAVLHRATGNALLATVGSRNGASSAAPVAVRSGGPELPVPVPARSEDVAAWLVGEVAKFVRAKDDDAEAPGPVATSTPWEQFGFDSLSMTDFISSCNRAFGLREDDALPDTAMFDYPNPQRLGSFIAEALANRPVQNAVGEPGTAHPATVGQAAALPLTEPDAQVAVAGLALRFPGPRTNSTPEGLWEFLCGGGDAMRSLPESRFPGIADLKGVYVDRAGLLHPDILEDAMAAKHLLEDPRFPISSAELKAIDPQQKLALQVAAEALAEARENGANLGCVGVFVGAQNPEHAQNANGAVGTFTAAGTALSILANRISFCLDLHGPSMTIDSACSSSFSALDTALKALRAGDCTAAIVLSVDLMMSSHRFETTCAAKMLSPRGRCATFSDQADGYARGEGCGAIVITAEDPGAQSPAWARICAVGLNQDGQSANLTSPNRLAQEACIKDALARSGLSETLDKVAFVEAHGTGTKLGDPIELEALANVFGGRSKPLPVGAVKTNLGHLEAAAGMAGLIKTILCLAHRELPANLHCAELNPRIARLQRKCELAFPRGPGLQALAGAGPLFAGVSSFGFGGTNGHVIVGSVVQSRADKALRGSQSRAGSLLGSPKPAFVPRGGTDRWEVDITGATLDTLRNHRVGDVEVIPATTYIEIAGPIVDACLRPDGAGPSVAYELRDLRFANMLFVSPKATKLVLVLVLDRAIGRLEFRSSDEATLYASMTVEGLREPKADTLDLEMIQDLCSHPLPAGDALYETVGNGYRAGFRGLKQAWADKDGAVFLGKVELDASLPTAVQASVWLDVASHAGIAMLEPEQRGRPIYAKTAASYYSAPQDRKLATSGVMWSVLEKRDENLFDMSIFDAAGSLCAEVQGFGFGFFKEQVRRRGSTQGPDKALCFAESWEPVPADLLFGSGPLSKPQQVSCSTVEELHERILDILKTGSGERAPLQVLVTDAAQVGYLRSLQAEYPRWRVQIVTGEGQASALQFFACEERELRLERDPQGGPPRPLCRRLRPQAHPVTEDETSLMRVQAGATYLVTGGAGALGALVTDALLARGAGQVVVVSRSGPGQVPKSTSSGVVHLSADITKVEDPVRVGQEIAAQGLGPLRGVVHCAGVLRDATIPTLETSSFAAVAAPKAPAVRNLHHAGLLDKADFFVAFSSLAAGVGTQGQANYAAANLEMDDAVVELRKTGLAACSVRWGPWAAGGMATDTRSSENWERLGFPQLRPDEAIRALFRLPRDCHAVTTIARFDTARVASNVRTYLGLAQEGGQAARPAAKLDAAGLLSLVQACVAEVNPSASAATGGGGAEAQGWRDVGLDSLSMVELRNTLQERLDLDLHDTVLFDYPTPAILVRYLLSKMAPGAEEADNVQQQPDRHALSSAPAPAAAAASTGVPEQGATSIIGAACRLPGCVSDPESFWELLESGRDTLGAAPAERLGASSAYTTNGAFMQGVDLFDAGHFGITPKEAENMDPQQRLALEVAYEALTDAGLLNESGTVCKVERTGVFAGAMTNDWAGMRQGQSPGAFTATGHSKAIIANRISFQLGLTGPSMCIDTACSSSLVALDAACSALERGDCEAAVVLGVNLLLAAKLYEEECAAHMLSPRGRCFTFAEGADGYARGEGCVALVLARPGSQAAALAGPPLGSVLSTAVNQDGRSANLTSPKGTSQEAVIRQAVGRAGLVPSQVAYVETHGTGTDLGDAIEVAALSKALGKGRAAGESLCVGAVKPVVGHGEGAAGLTAILKALLCLRHGRVPGNVSLPSPEHLSRKVAKVAHPSMVFPCRGESHALKQGSVVGVSSFGFGGTNAHVLLQAGSEAVSSTRPRRDWNHVRFSWMPELHILELNPQEQARVHPVRLCGLGMTQLVPAHVMLDNLLWSCRRAPAWRGASADSGWELVDVEVAGHWRRSSTMLAMKQVFDDAAGAFVLDTADNKTLAHAARSRPVEMVKASSLLADAGPWLPVDICDDFYDAMQSSGYEPGQCKVQRLERSGELLVMHFGTLRPSPNSIVPLAALSEGLQALAWLQRREGEPKQDLVCPWDVLGAKACSVGRLQDSPALDWMCIVDGQSRTVLLAAASPASAGAFDTVLHLRGVRVGPTEWFGASPVLVQTWKPAACGSTALVPETGADVEVVYMRTTGPERKAVLDMRSQAKAFARSEKALLCLVTQTDSRAEHAAAWGLAASLRKELSGHRVVLCVDLAPSLVAERGQSAVQALVRGEIANCLAGALQGGSSMAKHQPSFQVRFDAHGERHVQRLEERPISAVCPPPVPGARVSGEGTFLITGGLGGLGLLTAKALLELGARSLVLVSRSGRLRQGLAASDAEAALLSEIMAWPGAKVLTLSCDVSSRQALEALFDKVDAEGPKLVGIVHSAGVLRDAPLVSQDEEDHFAPVFDTKASSALAMHHIVQERGYALDLFLLYSSAASLLGVPAESNYAAANAVLDNLARLRRAAGLAGLSVNWGGWSGLGLAVHHEGALESIVRLGMGLVAVPQGLAFIKRAVLARAAQGNFGVTPVHWGEEIRSEHDLDYLTEMVQGHKRKPSALPSAPRATGRSPAGALASMGRDSSTCGDARGDVDLAQGLADILCACGVPSMSMSFTEAGLDSLRAIEIVGMARDRLGVTLTPTFYLDHDDGQALAEHLLRSAGPTLGDADRSSQPDSEQLPDAVAEGCEWIERAFKPEMRLFCFAYAGGHPNVFQCWLPYLPANVQLCPMAMPGYGKQAHNVFWESVADLAGHVAHALPVDVPFALVGSCLGAIISFEVNRCLREAHGPGLKLLRLFAIACSAPQQYSDALRLLYSNRLKDNAFFVPSDKQAAALKFRDLSEEDRDWVAKDLRKLGFFKDDESLRNLAANQDYFEHVMGQLAGQMQLAERYAYIPLTPEQCGTSVTSISGASDDTIPEGWPENWAKQSTGDGPYRHVDVQDGGHYIVQTHPECVVREILHDLERGRV